MSDPLVNLTEDKGTSAAWVDGNIQLTLAGDVKKLFDKNRDHLKEKGVGIICASRGLLVWEYKDKTVRSPVYIQSLEGRVDKARNIWLLQGSNEWFLNPFLQHAFLACYDINLSEALTETGDLPELEFLQTFLSSRGVKASVEQSAFVANLHYHRFDILRDLESLRNCSHWQPHLLDLLGESAGIKNEVIELTDRNIVSVDADHQEACSAIMETHVVIQGPPGTGKSQFITNILGKTMFGQHPTLVVSEKYVALKVIQQRLQQLGLGKYCLIQEEQNSSKAFLNQLQSVWREMEGFSYQPAFFADTSPQLIAQLQSQLNVLRDPEVIGGVSFSEFRELWDKSDAQDALFQSTTASIREWLDHRENLEKLYNQGLPALTRFLPQKLLSKEQFDALERNIHTLKSRWKQLHQHFSIPTLLSVTQCMRRASFAQLMSNELHQPYFRTLNPTKSEFKKFQRLYGKYNRAEKALENESNQRENWKAWLTMEETVGLLDGLRSSKFWRRWKAKKRWKEVVKSPYTDPILSLENWKNYLVLESHFKEMELRMVSLGIENRQQMDWIHSLQFKIHQTDFEQWRNTPMLQNSLLAQNNADLHILFQNIRTFLMLSEDQPLEEVFKRFDLGLPLLVRYRNLLTSMSELLYKQMGEFTSPKELENSILKSNWVLFTGKYTIFADFTPQKLAETLTEILEKQQAEHADFIEKIKARTHKQWEQYHLLLSTGTKKLRKEQRLLKEKLKSGKSILIKEFGKQRAHPTMRELLQSDARVWIDALVPVFLLTPSQVASFLHIDERFSMVLFDEATQIPLSYALGSMQRANRVVVVGDSEQMSPSFFFQSGDSEPIDLLHQASFTWSSIWFKHHYRSDHPALIHFSNRHFYRNSLMAYPSPKIEESPIRAIYISDGVYKDRQNFREAAELANRVRPYLQSNYTLGVVALSQKQQDAVMQSFSDEDRALIEAKRENDTFFMVPLDQIQGGECDVLFISLGYGPNEEGDFHKNFGPLNRVSGRRRLNVLFTRARKKMIIFHSFKPEDLALSENDAVNLLRQFLNYAHTSGQETVVLPYNLPFSVSNENQLDLPNVWDHVPTAQELVTLHEVLCQRGWKVNYV